MKTIRLYGDLNYGSGYNTALRGLVQALEAIGYSPDTLRVIGAIAGCYYREFEPVDWLSKYVYQDWQHEIEAINLVMLNPAMVDTYFTTVGGRYNIAYCAWETDRLPAIEWTVDGEKRTCVSSLNRFNEIWVPTNYVRNTFEDCGVTVPIHVVRHALLRGLLAHPAKARCDAARFYTIGSWNARKNVEGLLRAYFATGWHVESGKNLVCHCVPSSREETAVASASWLAKEGAQNLYDSAANPASLPGFGLLTTPRSYEEMYQLHLNNDVFVTASRGEGFCLPVVEALALGNPVIASGPWLDDNDLLPVAGSGLRRVRCESVPITPMPECRGYELTHRWWEPLFDSLVYALQQAHTLPMPKARAVRDHYSPGAVGSLLAKRLKEVPR